MEDFEEEEEDGAEDGKEDGKEEREEKETTGDEGEDGGRKEDGKEEDGREEDGREQNRRGGTPRRSRRTKSGENLEPSCLWGRDGHAHSHAQARTAHQTTPRHSHVIRGNAPVNVYSFRP